MMDPRRYPSDAASNGSTASVWSSTDSVSYVYTDDPDWAPWWGFDGVRGAVTRKEDRRDDRRVRLAAHFLRGPFAGHKSKKHHHHHHRDSDSRSDYSSSSGSSSSSPSSSRRHRQFSRGPSPIPPPPQAYPGSPHPHHQHPQHFGNFPQGPPMGMMGHRPPPPPMAGPPPQPGFEAGFIQLNGGGPPPPQRDPVWGHDAQYNGEPEVWD